MMTTTLDTPRFLRLFPDAQLHTLQSQTPHNITIHYEPEPYPNLAPDLQPSKHELIMKKIAAIIKGEFKQADGKTGPLGVLTFGSGKPEVADLLDRFKSKFPAYARYGRALHSETSEEDQKAIVNMPFPKFIFATNIAETSVTVEHTSYVIDTGEYKQMLMNSPSLPSVGEQRQTRSWVFVPPFSGA